MGYQYAQQLIHIFGPWSLERKAGRVFSEDEGAVIGQWEAQIGEHAPEILRFCEGWAAVRLTGACLRLDSHKTISLRNPAGLLHCPLTALTRVIASVPWRRAPLYVK